MYYHIKINLSDIPDHLICCKEEETSSGDVNVSDHINLELEKFSSVKGKCCSVDDTVGDV